MLSILCPKGCFPSDSNGDRKELHDGSHRSGVPKSLTSQKTAESESTEDVTSPEDVVLPVPQDFQRETSADEDLYWLAFHKRNSFDPRTLLPPLLWLPPYVRTILGRATEADSAGAGSLPYSLKGDVIGGLTVGCMLVPQSLAFAMLAAVPVEAGLYASFLPLLVYAIFGTIRQVQAGPTALMSLLTGQALDSMEVESADERMKIAAFVSLAVGAISVLLGALRFGFIIDFMSHSVMSAFCSAAGITIATSQLKHMLGIDIERKHYWWETVWGLVTRLDEIDVPTILLGFVLLALLMLLKQWKGAGSVDKRRAHKLWRRFPVYKESRTFQALKTVADMSSLFCVISGWVWGFVYRKVGVDTVKTIGHVDNSGFHFILPGDGSYDRLEWGSLLSSAAMMAVVGFLETMAVGGKFAAQNRYSYDPNQELLALGLSNVASAVMSGYPTTGSFSRTAVNASFGATSLVACATSSLLVLIATLVLLPVVAMLPLAALAPIIIQGAIGVVDLHHFGVAFRANFAEFGVMLATFVTSLAVSVKYGLLVGFGFSVLKTMHDLGNPNMVVCGRLPDGSFRDIRNFPKAELTKKAVVVRMDARLNFANARKLKEFCLKAVSVRESNSEVIEFVIIDAKSINHIDLTGCEMLEVIAETLWARRQRLIIANLKGPASKRLARAGIHTAIKKHNGHLCIDMDQAVGIVEGADPRKASEDLRDLLSRVDLAKKQTMQASKSNFYAGSSPKANS
mmetsp:Transcript_22096/g.51578  ORF Transcript_22096/g.51578 Transcript_22096/m.51578 type:complete len:739 (-) Transcript_22096:115-2331(-)